MFRFSFPSLPRAAFSLILALCATGATAGSAASVEALLADDAAQRLHANPGQLQPKPITDLSLVPASRAVIPVGTVQPLAILHPQAGIREHADLRGKTVCLVEQGGYGGLMNARFGAIEQPHSSLAGALLALRSGDCLAVVHDDNVLQELVKLPQWQSFASLLPVGQPRTLAFVVPAAEVETVAGLKQAALEWQASARPAMLARQVASGLTEEVRIALQRGASN